MPRGLHGKGIYNGHEFCPTCRQSVPVYRNVLSGIALHGRYGCSAEARLPLAGSGGEADSEDDDFLTSNSSSSSSSSSGGAWGGMSVEGGMDDDIFPLNGEDSSRSRSRSSSGSQGFLGAFSWLSDDEEDDDGGYMPDCMDDDEDDDNHIIRLEAERIARERQEKAAVKQKIDDMWDAVADKYGLSTKAAWLLGEFVEEKGSKTLGYSILKLIKEMKELDPDFADTLPGSYATIDRAFTKALEKQEEIAQQGLDADSSYTSLKIIRTAELEDLFSANPADLEDFDLPPLRIKNVGF